MQKPSAFNVCISLLALLITVVVCDNLSAQPAAPATKPAEPKAFTQKIPGTELQFDMVFIPGGRFKMGSPQSEKHRKPDEGPQVDVVVEPFYMGKFEVTWDLYNEFLAQYSIIGSSSKAPVAAGRQADAVSYPTPIYDIEVGPALQRMGGRNAGYPVVIASPLAAKQFTKWLSVKTGRFYRLPTEAEWEYAARGGTTTAYFFGDDPKLLTDYAWTWDNCILEDGDSGYHKVGQKKPNPFGLYDIYGNAAEIVLDQYDANWYGRFEGKQVSAGDTTYWPHTEYPRIVRGGGYESEATASRSAARQRITVRINSQDPCLPKSPYWWSVGFDIGFRIVSPVNAPDEKVKQRYWDIDNDLDRETLKRDREIRQMVDEIRPKKEAN